MLPVALSLAGCAAQPPAAGLDWPSFVASFVGDARVDAQYGTATVKDVTNADVATSTAGGNARFDHWCSSQHGKTYFTQAPDHRNILVSRFHQAVAAKSNAEQAQGLPWRPTVAVACLDERDRANVIGLMLSEPGRRQDALVVQGKALDRLTRVFFDAQQAVEFTRLYEQREAERSAAAMKASQERESKRSTQTQRLRSDPRVGDRTGIGIIIELRGPLALIQYDERYRSLSGKPQTEWIRVETLTAPSDGQ